MHAEADVALATNRRLAGVNAHPYPKLRVIRPRVLCQPVLAGDRRRHGVLRPSKGDEEGVALGVDFVPVVLGEHLSEDPLVIRERIPVALTSKALEQLRRTLNVREEEGDGANRQLASELTRRVSHLTATGA